MPTAVILPRMMWHYIFIPTEPCRAILSPRRKPRLSAGRAVAWMPTHRANASAATISETTRASSRMAIIMNAISTPWARVAAVQNASSIPIPARSITPMTTTNLSRSYIKPKTTGTDLVVFFVLVRCILYDMIDIPERDGRKQP